MAGDAILCHVQPAKLKTNSIDRWRSRRVQCYLATAAAAHSTDAAKRSEPSRLTETRSSEIGRCCEGRVGGSWGIRFFENKPLRETLAGSRDLAFWEL